MSNPTPGDVHVNRALTNMTVGYQGADDMFDTDTLAPIVTSDNQTDIWWKFPKDVWFRDSLQIRAPGAEAAEGGYDLAQDSFYIPVWAMKTPIPDQMRSNADSVLAVDQTGLDFLQKLERIRRQKAFVAAFLVASVWGTTWTGVASGMTGNQFLQWSDAAATPLNDIEAMVIQMWKNTGFKPNTLAIGPEVWSKLKFNAQLLNRINGGATRTNIAEVSLELAAGLMGLQRIIVLGAVENTAADGATFAGNFIAGKVALLLRVDANPSPKTPTAARTFTWQQYAGTRNGIRIKKYRVEPTASDYIEIESTFVHKIVAADLGTWLTLVVA